jgi:hypothetical protein
MGVAIFNRHYNQRLKIAAPKKIITPSILHFLLQNNGRIPLAQTTE